MDISFSPDFPVNDESCKAATGKTISEWILLIEQNGFASKRREAIQLIYDETGRGKDVWWPTTIWVEFERQRGIVKKDGLGEGYNICCTKSFKLPPEALFEAFSTEERFNSWVQGWKGSIEDGAAFSVAGCSGKVGRIRPGKDIRMAWQSPNCPPTEIEVQFNKMGDKTTINFYHKRIQSRDEADGLRRAWGEALDRLKQQLG